MFLDILWFQLDFNSVLNYTPKNQSKKKQFFDFFLDLFGFCLDLLDFFVWTVFSIFLDYFWIFFRFQLHFNCLFFNLIFFTFFFDFNQVDFLDFIGFQFDFLWDFNWILISIGFFVCSLAKRQAWKKKIEKKSNPIFFIFLTDTVLPPFDTYFSQNMQLSLAMFDYQGTSFSSNMWILNCQVCLPEEFHQWKWATAPNQACT